MKVERSDILSAMASDRQYNSIQTIVLPRMLFSNDNTALRIFVCDNASPLLFLS